MVKYTMLVFVLLVLAFPLRAAGLVDINTANAATLAAEIKWIGQAKAVAIVKYRNQHGPYNNVDDLLKVRGIGERVLRKIQPFIQVVREKH